MTHKQFNLAVSKDVEITVHFDLDFDGTQMIANNIEFGNKSGRIGTIKNMEDYLQIHSHNPEVFNEELKGRRVKQILSIAEEETPRFIP